MNDDDPPAIDAPESGYYGSCFRCHEPNAALFRRPFSGAATWDLCRGCIIDLGLERPVGAFDLPEIPEPPTADGVTLRSLWHEATMTVHGIALLAVLGGASVIAATLAWIAIRAFGGR